MYTDAFKKFYWGFFFTLLDFKIQGFDILPDIVGYILFYLGFKILLDASQHFTHAKNYDIVMIILSIFTIYEKPVQNQGININPFGLVIGIISLIFSLFTVYHLFMGIKEMAEERDFDFIADDADRRWNQYLLLQLGVLLAFFLIMVPGLAFLYIILLFIASLVLAFVIIDFMKKCGEFFSE